MSTNFPFPAGAGMNRRGSDQQAARPAV
ncbi:hypothetical protein SSPSH_003501, partial [Salinisphaera shabanensis E1L3A]